ncbi:site-specific integrase [Candidatus Pacearchaeota archaeon]|nr:site-specific integrase [Candidatus Pacearchaeota archaeon]
MEQEGKIDIHHRKEEFERAFRNLKQDSEILEDNKQLILRFIDDCEAGKTLRNRQRKKIGPGRLIRLVDITKRYAKWFNKPFRELTQEDLEKVNSNLEKDVYPKHNPNGELAGNLSHSSKAYYKKTFKKFNKWMQENKINNNLDCSYIETYEILKEIEAISKEDIEKMIDQTPSVMNKAILMVLFDSGARAEEFLNLRLKHISQKGDNYFLRIEYSKTLPRTVILPIASKYLEKWLDHPDCTKDRKGQLFTLTYDALRMFIVRSGKRILNRSITPHTLRHSSASYYCNHLTQYQLCKRYGWSMSSKMPARYIDRSGVLDDEVAEKIKVDETSSLIKENQKLKEEMTFLKERIESIENALMQKAAQQQSPIFLNTSLGQEAYSGSGTNINGIFRKY